MRHSTAAKLFLSDAEGNILLLQRSDTHPRTPLTWDPPGGFIEPGEDLVTALKRELMEEAGLSMGGATPYVIYADTNYYENSSDNLPKSVVRVYFSARIDSVKPEITLSWEHSASTWATPEECVQLLADTPFKDVSQYIFEHDLLQGTADGE